MNKIWTTFLCIVVSVSLLMGCSLGQTGGASDMEESTPNTKASDRDGETGAGDQAESDGADDGEATEPAEVDFSQLPADMFTERDGESTYDENQAIRIELDGSSAKASSNSVNINGSTIVITEDVTHIISGTLDDGMIIVDAPDTAKLQLVLDGVQITSSTSAPVYIKEADKVFVTLVGDNTLSSGERYIAIDENDIDAAVFSKQDLTFNGEGTLIVNAPAGHGIVSKDDLVFTGGTYSIAAAFHGIDANDSVRIKSADIEIDAGKDGIHSENVDDPEKGFVYIGSGTLNIESEGDGISSGYYMKIEDGEFQILAGGGHENGANQSSGGWGNFGGFGGGGFGGGGFGGGRPGGNSGGGITQTSTSSSSLSLSASDGDSSTSMKGMKSENSMLIEGGNFDIDSADDALHSNLSATVNGGTFRIASGDDALHAEDTLTITAGRFDITDSYEGLEALYIDVRGGDIRLVASDDGLNAAGGTDESGTTGGRDGMFGGRGFGGWGSGNSNGSITVSGGTLYLNSSGDGMDANGTLEITGGCVTVVGPTSGDTAVLDYDKTGIISGGTFVGSGSSMMAQSLDGEGQGVIGISVGSQSAGTEIIVSDEKGNELLSYAPELAFEIFIYSSPEIISGESYHIVVGSQSGEIEAK